MRVLKLLLFVKGWVVVKGDGVSCCGFMMVMRKRRRRGGRRTLLYILAWGGERKEKSQEGSFFFWIDSEADSMDFHRFRDSEGVREITAALSAIKALGFSFFFLQQYPTHIQKPAYPTSTRNRLY